ncbi:hypothetical protein DM01DRAFT_1321639 [Hesseltinella vesiculosa]|uniref:Mitochondrial genome maintenance protein Mgr2 n=1 Tax=Hesseltinella vesiculosa TaxID=101127 RepID=A0A1X2GI46_9FUNG|nr:hypothetical protein DM01DRAFT_1321639 [Hesseltinella vesiculosa]
MEPSTAQKMKMGALMGGTVGLCVGFVFGGISILRYGAGRRGAFTMLSQYMLGSAASFGFFMSIGSVIRSEGANRPLQWMPVRVLPRQDNNHNQNVQ